MSNLGNKDIMAKNIRHYMELNNKTRTEICKDLKVSYSTFSDWVNAKTYPRIDKIELMANYFGIEKSDLVEEKTPHMVKEESAYYINEETRQIAQEIFESKEMRVLFDIARDTDPDTLRHYADFLKKLKNKDS